MCSSHHHFTTCPSDIRRSRTTRSRIAKQSTARMHKPHRGWRRWRMSYQSSCGITVDYGATRMSRNICLVCHWDLVWFASHPPGGPFTRVFPSAPSTPSSPHRRSLAMTADAHFNIPYLPQARAPSPPPQLEVDGDGNGSATEDEGLGKGASKSWLGDLEG